MSDDIQPNGKKPGKNPSNRTVEPTPTDSKKLDKSLDSQAQDHIGRQLKAMYEDIVHQPIPDEIRALLEKLDQPKGAKKPLSN